MNDIKIDREYEKEIQGMGKKALDDNLVIAICQNVPPDQDPDATVVVLKNNPMRGAILTRDGSLSQFQYKDTFGAWGTWYDLPEGVKFLQQHKAASQAGQKKKDARRWG